MTAAAGVGRPVRAVEINGDDAAWLRGQPLPDGVELKEVDEVEFWGTTYDRSPSGLYVPTQEDPAARLIARRMRELVDEQTPPMPVGIDLFCGAGGFSLGVHEAGFDVVAAVEWDAAAAMTYLVNLGHPDCQILFASEKDERRWKKNAERVAARRRKGRQDDVDLSSRDWIGSAYRASSNMDGGCRAFVFGDISHVTGPQLMDAAEVDEVDVVFGGPPCQGLSTSNTKACLEDPRNGMIWEFMRLVAEIKPKTFIIENVPAILTIAKGALFNAIARLANDAGYDVTAQKIDACAYGVPQHRVRALIVGTLEGSGGYTFPMPTHWAIGRPVDDNGWSMLDGGSECEPALPAEAQYDPATRRWSFGNETNVAHTPKAERVETQGSLALGPGRDGTGEGG